MEILILKSAACLAILMVFYKLFLEKLAIHKFKRFYLLGALVVSIVIPFITFIKYIEPIYDFGTFDPNLANTPPYFPAEIVIKEAEPINYLPIILWSIYGLGALLFASKFCINLFGIISKINKNEKQKHSNFISVLLNDLIVPHTFFSYIFLNKTKFEKKAIPKEVLLHEQTHASQKHSLDILFIELFQIIFWFNPLLYFIKKDIKLNHEFLADDAVLKQGIDSSTYQETLLQFTSTENEIPLAHAINYSLIKKRFTIMKTKTSKKAVWFRSLLLIPLLGGLLFGFSSTKEVENEVVPAIEINSSKIDTSLITDVIININKDEDIFIDEKLTNLESLKLEINKLNTNLTTKQKQKFVFGEIFHHKNTSKTLIQNIQEIFTECNIYSHSTTNVDFKINDNSINKNKLNLPFMTMENLSDADKKIYLYKLNEYKKWLEKSKSKKTIQITDKGYVLRNKNNEIIISFDSNYKVTSEPKSLENSPWKIDEKLTYVVTYTEDSKVKKPTLTVNGIVCDGCTLNLSKDSVSNLILSTTSNDNVLSFNLKVPGKPTVNIKGNELNEKAKQYLNSTSLGTVIQLFNIKTVNKQKLPPVSITLVNKNDKNYSQSPSVKKGGKPTLPPPPPPAPFLKNKKETKTGYININGEPHYFVNANNRTKYYTKNGIEVDKKGNALSSTQTDGSKVIPGQKITKVYKDGKVTTTFKKTWEDDDMSVPPPPPPAPTLDHIVNMAKKGASFFYNGTSISSDKAIEILKNNSEINISSHSNNGKATVHLSTKPISAVNGKASFSEDKKRIYNNRKKALGSRKEARANMLTKQKDARKDMLLKRRQQMEMRQKMLKTSINEKTRPLAEQFKGMENNGSAFFYEGEKISEAKAIELVKENQKLNISMHNNNGKSTVHLSKKGIKTVNGKLVKKEN